MRCPDCGKFVAYGEPEIDGSAEVSEDTVIVSGEVMLTCEECGTGLKSASVEGQQTLDYTASNIKPCGHNQSDPATDAHEWGITDETFDPSDRTEGKGRGMKTFYGFTATIKLACQHEGCEAVHEVEITADEQASSFDEC